MPHPWGVFGDDIDPSSALVADLAVARDPQPVSTISSLSQQLSEDEDLVLGEFHVDGAIYTEDPPLDFADPFRPEWPASNFPTSNQGHGNGQGQDELNGFEQIGPHQGEHARETNAGQSLDGTVSATVPDTVAPASVSRNSDVLMADDDDEPEEVSSDTLPKVYSRTY